MELPVDFKQSMKELLGSGYDDFIASFDDKPVSSLRVNTSKISTEEFERSAPFWTEKIPFVSNGYYIKDTDAWTKHPYYYAGLYYIQEASAMLPAETLPVSKGDAVLDLCAAPGGKSTQLVLNEPVVLISNDISFSRTIPLVKNLEMFGTGEYFVTCETPEKLACIYDECFDRILVDAPCSGEGMFRKDKGLISSYAKKGPKDYCSVQKEILDRAYMMLKKGGMLLYSTCTFSDIEDEEVILYLTGKYKDLTVLNIKKENGLLGPYDKYRDVPGMEGVVHAFPHIFNGEGHFMALIEKAGGDGDGGKSNMKEPDDLCKMPVQMNELVCHLNEDLRSYFSEGKYIVRKDGMVYLIPEGIKGYYDRNIRYVRTGIGIGSINRSGVFNPHTALALRLNPDEFDNTVNFAADDINVIRYLKGETLIVDDLHQKPDKGHVMICVDRHPLGFARSDGIRLKNLYEKGWIYK